MSKRITAERLAEIEIQHKPNMLHDPALEDEWIIELIQALKAERKHAEELEARLNGYRNGTFITPEHAELQSRIEAGLKLADDFGGNIGKRIREKLGASDG